VRYGVAFVLAIGLLVALPAAARQQAETVTVKVGETVPLTTVFDKKKTYTIVMSGLVTMTLKVGNLTQVYDPFYGAADANCTNSGPSVYLQIKDASGNLIDHGAANNPTCRNDHRYEFVVNDRYPPAWDLHGKATAYITLQPNPRDWTVSGSFKLQIEVEPTQPAAVIRFVVNANEKRNVVARAHLNGRGVMEAPEITEGGLADRARLVPVTTFTGVTPELTFVREGLRDRRVVVEATSGELTMQGAAGSADERFSLRLNVEVVASNVSSCPERSKTRRGARGKVVLIDYPRGGKRDAFVNASLDLPCGVDDSWVSPDSNVGITVTRAKKKP
jgi:hypothetical protein